MLCRDPLTNKPLQQPNGFIVPNHKEWDRGTWKSFSHFFETYTVDKHNSADSGIASPLVRRLAEFSGSSPSPVKREGLSERLASSPLYGGEVNN
jgi:hypothetical protein